MANLFSGLLWDARGQPIDVVWKKKKRMLVTRCKKKTLFDADVFDAHVLQLLGLASDREQLKKTIKERITKIVCQFTTAEYEWHGHCVDCGGRWPNQFLWLPTKKPIRIGKIQIKYRQAARDVIRTPKRKDEVRMTEGGELGLAVRHGQIVDLLRQHRREWRSAVSVAWQNGEKRPELEPFDKESIPIKERTIIIAIQATCDGPKKKSDEFYLIGNNQIYTAHSYFWGGDVQIEWALKFDEFIDHSGSYSY